MKNLLLYSFIGLLLFGCKHQKHDDSPLELNNGQKWEVNKDMKPHINQAEVILKEYISAGDTDYKKLAKALKDQNAKLIKSCTMEGKSHDELHKWLHPHMALIGQLGKSKEKGEAQATIEEITQSFEEYHQYFN